MHNKFPRFQQSYDVITKLHLTIMPHVIIRAAITMATIVIPQAFFQRNKNLFWLNHLYSTAFRMSTSINKYPWATVIKLSTHTLLLTLEPFTFDRSDIKRALPVVRHTRCASAESVTVKISAIRTVCVYQTIRASVWVVFDIASMRTVFGIVSSRSHLRFPPIIYI